MEKVRLLRITTVPISLQKLLRGQGRYMSAQGMDVHLASAAGPEVAEVTQYEGCPHHVLPLTRTLSPLKDLVALWHTIRLIRRLRPDIVHTHTPKAGLIGMLAAWLCRVPLRIHTIAGLPMMTARGWKKRLLEATERLTYFCAQQVWPNSQGILSYIQQQRMAPAHKLAVIGHGSSNGIDLQEFSREGLDQQTLDDLRQVYFESSEAVYVLAVGRMVRDKGIPELLAAFLSLYEENQRLRLVLVGPFEETRAEENLPTSVRTQIQEHPGITHIHWSDQVPYLMALADVLVHASHREGFPNVVLQAAAMSCPIICSDIPGNHDIVTDENLGYLFPLGDEAALRRQLLVAVSDLAVAQKKAARLLGIVQQQYDRKMVHQFLYHKYRALLDTH